LAYDASDKTVRIPNEEIRQEFVTAVENGNHKELAKLIQTSELLLKATIRGDEEAVAEALEAAHSAGTAPLFYNDEQALRSVIRFAYISCVDEYLRIEELPTGIGYADVVYIPKKGSALPAMIVELKMNKSADSAIDQIKNRNYPQALEGYGSDILLVGVSYDAKTKEHTCRIEKMKR
jgi:RecB family endonuclease NucS